MCVLEITAIAIISFVIKTTQLSHQILTFAFSEVYTSKPVYTGTQKIIYIF